MIYSANINRGSSHEAIAGLMAGTWDEYDSRVKLIFDVVYRLLEFERNISLTVIVNGKLFRSKIYRLRIRRTF